MKKKLFFYTTEQGKVPFQEWLEELKDLKGAAKIQTHLNRLAHDYYGDFKNLKGGLHELRVNYGPGYRIYFTGWRRKLILLLVGGIKKTQNKDIEQARIYWQDYKARFKK